MTSSTLSSNARAREARYAARLASAIRALAHFSTAADAHLVPSRLIAPVSRSAFRRMDEDARRALIAERVTAEHRARFDEEERLRVERHAEAMRNAEAKAERRIAEAERQARLRAERGTRKPTDGLAAPSRYLVSCAHGCGELLPTSGPRPVVRWCAAGAAEQAARTRAERRERRRRAETVAASADR